MKCILIYSQIGKDASSKQPKRKQAHKADCAQLPDDNDVNAHILAILIS